MKQGTHISVGPLVVIALLCFASPAAGEVLDERDAVRIALANNQNLRALSLRPDESAANTNLATVRQGDLVEVAAASGTVEPDIQFEVKSRASGEVIEVVVEEGDEVTAGDVLVRLDPRDAEQALREAEMDRSRANDDLTQARAQLLVTQAQATEA